MMKKVELVFIPNPMTGHLSSTIELAYLLLNQNHQYLSITLLLPNLTNFDINTVSSHSRIRFIILPPQPQDQEYFNTFQFKPFIQGHKQRIIDAVTELYADDESPTFAGFVVDFLYVCLMDLANELQVPTYVFITSNAGFIALVLHFQQLCDCHNKDMDELLDSANEFIMPGFVNAIPSKTISTLFFHKYASESIHENSRRFREADGILVNTFSELEPNIMNWFSNSTKTSKLPPIFSVGPILDSKKKNLSQGVDILKWLDEQPPSSVVFLCFGSMAIFNEDQIKEIALALERIKVRFLWSLRLAKPGDKFGMPRRDYTNTDDVLPAGFLDRTVEIGRVIGWAPQVEILAHPATGGFISHCGWNSILESLWYGVPMAVLPLYAEQHFNAFMMMAELGLVMLISSDFSMYGYMEKGSILSAEKIESGIRKLMEDNEEIKKRVKIKSEESKKAIMEGGSSFLALKSFIDIVFAKYSP